MMNQEVNFDAEVDAVHKRSTWRILGKSLLRNWPALIGLIVIISLTIIAIFAPFIAPYNPNRGLENGLSDVGGPLPPSSEFLFGTDANGRDVLSRLIYGARVSLTIGILANGLATFIGVTVGIVSAYFGGWIDTLLMRVTDIIMSFPVLLFALALISVTGPSVVNMILVIALIYWTYLARIVHSIVLSVKEREFITATKTLGVGHLQIMFKHILPHLWSAIIVYTSIGVATTILIEASLSYIGIGVPVPDASWGNMVAAGQAMYQIAPWLMIFPGTALLLTILSFNLVGDWLRDTLDPMQSEVR